MEKSELLGLAREYAKNTDLYELLALDSLKAKEPKEVQRAYRKVSIKYHPDKLGRPPSNLKSIYWHSHY
jgi:curved DNA-binding protein CbpA